MGSIVAGGCGLDWGFARGGFFVGEEKGEEGSVLERGWVLGCEDKA